MILPELAKFRPGPGNIYALLLESLELKEKGRESWTYSASEAPQVNLWLCNNQTSRHVCGTVSSLYLINVLDQGIQHDFLAIRLVCLLLSIDRVLIYSL